jgi:FkbM family methyltransferase
MFGNLPLRVVFDVGANEGQTARKYVIDHPDAEIHCFEPYEEAYAKLQNLASQHPRVKATQCALGQDVGIQMLWTNSASVTNSLLRNSPVAEKFQAPEMISPKGTATIRVSTIDSYCQESGVDCIDLLKIDTQGYDLRVLRGAENTISQGRIPLILAEVLFAPLYAGQNYFHEIYEHLWARDFRLVNLYAMARTEASYLSWCDALFVHADVLARRVSELNMKSSGAAT